MNWSKAKSILIIMFLIADVFLFYVTYSDDIIGRQNKDNTMQVLEYLKNQDIIIKGKIPNKGTPAPLLNVKYKLLKEEEAREIFFDSKERISIKNNKEGTSMESSKAFLEIMSSGDLFYLNKSLSNKEANRSLDEAMAKKNIEEFLELLDIDLNDTIIIKKNVVDNNLNIKYNQTYKGQFIDNSYLEIRACNSGVSYMKMLWFESVESGKTKKEVISPIKALMKLSELYREMENTIRVEDISQGYYFGSGGPFDIKQIEEGTAIAVWRLKTDLGIIYINAYNGNVEENY